MSDELTLSASMRFTKATVDELFALSATLDVSGSDYVRIRQTVGTSEEPLILGDVGTPGFIAGYNRDATNFVTFRYASGAADFPKVKAGEPFMFRCNGTAPYVKADTGACVIEYLLIED